MKKILAGLLLCTVIFTLTACSSNWKDQVDIQVSKYYPYKTRNHFAYEFMITNLTDRVMKSVAITYYIEYTDLEGNQQNYTGKCRNMVPIEPYKKRDAVFGGAGGQAIKCEIKSVEITYE